MGGCEWKGVDSSCWAIPAIDLLPFCLWVKSESESEKWKWKVKVKSEVKWKWSVFWSLNFFIFRYVEGGVRGNNNIGIKKCTTIFLWVLNLGQVGEILENFQKHPLGESFWKIFSKVWFWKNFTRDFPVKNEEIFLVRFSRKGGVRNKICSYFVSVRQPENCRTPPPPPVSILQKVRKSSW